MEVSKLKLDIASSSGTNTSEDRKSSYGNRAGNGSTSGRRATTAATVSGSDIKSEDMGCNSTGGKKS